MESLMALVEVQKRFRIILPDDQKAERANSAPGKEKKKKKEKKCRFLALQYMQAYKNENIKLNKTSSPLFHF